MNHFIMVASPPASGKTFIAKQLSGLLPSPVYLDKDSLTILSGQVFKAADEEYNRSSPFFEHNVRNFEYAAILQVAFEALAYNPYVLVNAPFSREIRDAAYLRQLRERLRRLDARLVPVWVHTDIEVCHTRMKKRASERDTWKLAHWDEYVKSRDFSIPEIEGLWVIDNSTDDSFRQPLRRLADSIIGAADPEALK